MTIFFKSSIDSNNNFGVFTLEPDSFYLYVPGTIFIKIPVNVFRKLYKQLCSMLDVSYSNTPKIIGYSFAEEIRSSQHPSKCDEIVLPICIKTPYNKTSYPSPIGHHNQMQAIKSGLQHLGVLESNCHEFLQLFWCTLFVPPCEENSSIPPCKEFCLGKSQVHLPSLYT